MKQILFDLDGTLTDSGEGIIHCAQETFRHFDIPVPTKDELRVIVGPPLRQSLQRFGIRSEDTEEAIGIYRKHYLEYGQFENIPYPGIECLLQRLKNDGHQLYVATSKPEALSVQILSYFGLASYFDAICGASADQSRDTKAKVISHLLSQISPIPGRIVMVGDTVYDVEGASMLQIPCIGVGWGYGNHDEMLNAGAIGMAHSIDELYQIIEGF